MSFISWNDELIKTAVIVIVDRTYSSASFGEHDFLESPPDIGLRRSSGTRISLCLAILFEDCVASVTLNLEWISVVLEAAILNTCTSDIDHWTIDTWALGYGSKWFSDCAKRIPVSASCTVAILHAVRRRSCRIQRNTKAVRQKLRRQPRALLIAKFGLSLVYMYFQGSYA